MRIAATFALAAATSVALTTVLKLPAFPAFAIGVGLGVLAFVVEVATR